MGHLRPFRTEQGEIVAVEALIDQPFVLLTVKSISDDEGRSTIDVDLEFGIGITTREQLICVLADTLDGLDPDGTIRAVGDGD